MKQKLINYFYKVADETAKLSTCVSKRVGAVLVKDGRILAIGYNGTPSGCKHCNQIFPKEFDRLEHHEWSRFNELHAEQNLISYCAKNAIPTNDTELFITLSPCIDCAKLILAAGIKHVHFEVLYDLDQSGLRFLLLNKVSISKAKRNNGITKRKKN